MTASAIDEVPSVTVPASVGQAPPALPSVLQGNPAILAIPNIIAGATGVALATMGVFPAQAAGAALPILLSATSIGLLIATIWAAALGQNLTATLYGTIFGFIVSFVAFSLGIGHGWYGIPLASTANASEIFYICWIVTFGALTITTVRMPWSFTLLSGVLDLALVMLLVGAYQNSATYNKIGGWLVLVFVAEVVYLYFNIMSTTTGGKGLPLGKPLLGRR